MEPAAEREEAQTKPFGVGKDSELESQSIQFSRSYAFSTNCREVPS